MRFSEEEKLTIIAEGEKDGARAVCAKYGINDETYRRWRYKVPGIQPKRPFSLEKRLRVLREGQQIGVKAVCAKYGISDQTFRICRYKAQGIKPRKHFSLKKKLKILEEGIRDGIPRTCAAYHISPFTYYSWARKLGFTKLPKRGRPGRFSEEEKLAILKEGYENGIPRTCSVYGISYPTYYYWRRRLGYCRSPRRSFRGRKNGVQRRNPQSAGRRLDQLSGNLEFEIRQTRHYHQLNQ
jgi:transposase-like protein